MPEPTYTRSTEDLYASLPAIHRDTDALDTTVGGGYPLKKFLSGMTDRVGAVADLIDRLDYEPPDAQDGDPLLVTSDLADPDTADVAWLPWLGQLLGTPVNTALPAAAQRDTVRSAVGGFRAGTESAIIAAAQSVLTGTRYVELHDHSINTPGDGGQWDVMLVARSSETPQGVNLVQAVIDKGAKPAGIVLHQKSVEPTWTVLQTQRPTWASWNTTWQNINETGL